MQVTIVGVQVELVAIYAAMDRGPSPCAGRGNEYNGRPSSGAEMSKQATWTKTTAKKAPATKITAKKAAPKRATTPKGTRLRPLGLAHRYRPRRRRRRSPHHRSADAPASCQAIRGAGLARERQWRGPHCRIHRAERRTAAVESLRSQADHGVRRRHGRAIGSDAVAVRDTRRRPDLAEGQLTKKAPARSIG